MSAQSTEKDAPRLEWQVAEGSHTAHVVDASIPRKRRGERGWKSGPRAVCGRYPQRNLEHPWFALSVEADGVVDALRHYGRKQCVECRDRTSLPERSQS